ncbi:hypothetical protein VU04_00190 [Desulfobulbus sp. TB]|nr:hypothetical protein [Desulfobulbus sp. TB]
MHVNWKEKSGKGIIAGRVAGSARLGIGCLTVCCMMCLMVTSASAAGTGKTKVNLDFTKIKKALGKSTTTSNYPIAPKTRQMSSSTKSTNASTTASTAGSLSNTMVGMADIAGSMASTMADVMAGSIAGSMAPMMTGNTSSRTSGSTPPGMPTHNMGSIQMDSSIAKVIEETRNQMMNETMQGMFGNQSMMADMQKKIMSESMPGSIQSSVLGSVQKSVK